MTTVFGQYRIFHGWINFVSPGVLPEKNRQMSIKLPKNEITRKMIDFDTFTKIA